MYDVIVDKLTVLLAAPLTSEKDVVYFLVEVRKCLELRGEQREFAQLKMFCDWAAHPVLDRGPAQRVISLIEHHAVGGGKEIQAALETVLDFSTFRSEIDQFCTRRGLRSENITSPARWPFFLLLYAAVIEDCPMKSTSQAGRYSVVSVSAFVEQRPERCLLVLWGCVESENDEGEGGMRLYEARYPLAD